LSKPWGHVLMHNVMTPGKQKLVITGLGLKRAKINSYVAFLLRVVGVCKVAPPAEVPKHQTNHEAPPPTPLPS
jgi:hypothetical protein